jgi:hypothetical protein
MANLPEPILIAPFKASPKQVKPWNDKSDTLLLWGPSGSGKSRLAGEKVHGYCLHYPKTTAIIARKVAEDLEKSVIRLMNKTIIDIDNEPRCQYFSKRKLIEYDNGSEIWFIGIKDDRARKALRSIGQDGSVDIFWGEEGTEFEEEDHNAMTARMRGTAAPWRQMIYSTNPGAELHWINRRLIIGGEASHYLLKTEDNPYNAYDYQDKLDRLTGLERARLRDGIWTSGVGRVVDTWRDDYNPRNPDDARGNVTLEAEYEPGYGPVVWFADDGYAGRMDEKTGWFTERSNPRVFLLAQVRKDGRIAIFDEDYRIMTLASAHIQEVVKNSEMYGWPMPKKTVYDGAAPALGGELYKSGLKAVPIRVKIEEGIKELREWCAPDINGIRKLIVNPRCRYFRFEMGSWSYDKYHKPMEAHNHGPDAARYGTWHEAYGGLSDVNVAAPGIDSSKADAKIAKVMARLSDKMERLYGNAS